ncbi:MAG: hypothetical protein GC164_00135 [Phycisphaera sp.]|nr:hypothetical protein [Phycisphaera sp.]
MPTLAAITDTLNDPHKLHAALVHFPIVLAFVGLVLTIALTVTLGKSKGLRWWCVALYLVAALTGFIAMDAGEDSVNDLDTSNLSDGVKQLIHDHEEMGEKVWWSMLIVGSFVALTAVPKKPVRVTFAVLALVTSLMNVGLVVNTAYHGGEIVYGHGVGVPQMATSP